MLDHLLFCNVENVQACIEANERIFFFLSFKVVDFAKRPYPFKNLQSNLHILVYPVATKNIQYRNLCMRKNQFFKSHRNWLLKSLNLLLYPLNSPLVLEIDGSHVVGRYSPEWKISSMRVLPKDQHIQWTLVLKNMVFNEFLVIPNKISRSLHFWQWKISYKTSVLRTPLLRNSLLYRAKILPSSSSFIMDFS